MLRPVLQGRVHRHLKDGAVGGGRAENHLRHDVVERGAGGLATRAALEVARHGELLRLEDRHLDPRKQAAVHLRAGEVGEARFLRPLDAYRYHRHAGLVGDEAGAVVDFHQAAGPRQAPFREDHQRRAALDLVDELARRERPRRVERQGVHVFDDRLHPPFLGELVIDGEDGIVVEDRERDLGVEQADVVQRDDRVGAGLGDVVDAHDFEAVDDAEDDRREIAQRVGRKNPEDPHRGGQRADAERGEDHSDRPSRPLLQAGDGERAHRHEQRRHHVDASDDAGAMVGRRPRLDGGERRHDEEAATHRQQHQVDADAPGARLAEEFGDALHRHGGGRAVQRQGEIERHEADEDACHGRRQHQGAAVDKPGRQSGAERDADREHREIDRHDQLVAAEHDLDHGRQQTEDDRADEPEQADEDRAVPQSAILPQVAHDVVGRADEIVVDLEVRRPLAAAGNRQGREPAHRREAERQERQPPGRAAVFCRQRRDEGPGDDGDERRALDERVARRQVVHRKMVRQNPVFDRAEQRREHAEEGERDEQDRQRMQLEAQRGDRDREEFDELEPAGDERLVVAVGEFAADCRQDEGRQDEQRRRKLDQRIRMDHRHRIEQQCNDRHLEEGVVEGREKLAPEKRRELAALQKRAAHGGTSARSSSLVVGQSDLANPGDSGMNTVQTHVSHL